MPSTPFCPIIHKSTIGLLIFRAGWRIFYTGLAKGTGYYFEQWIEEEIHKETSHLFISGSDLYGQYGSAGASAKALRL
jgi:hypothetical protein